MEPVRRPFCASNARRLLERRYNKHSSKSVEHDSCQARLDGSIH
ncbi:hypothetical protein PG5_60800 [Pseudomonas sp. G5(2012)]|nr:hypothetical protein PG5_60800 [Pseudomonas sp. G5(2012)]